MTGEFPCNGDGDDRASFAAPFEVPPAPVQSTRGLLGPRSYGGRLAGTAAAEGDAWAQRTPLMPGGLDEQAACVLGAGFGDRAVAAPLAGGVLAGNESELAAEELRVREAAPVADLGAEPERGEGVDPAQAAQAGDGARPGRFRDEFAEGVLERAAAAEQMEIGRASCRERV